MELLTGVPVANTTPLPPVISSLKVQDIQVLLHPLDMRGLRNDHNALLVQETKTDLCVVLSIPAADLHKDRIAEEAVLSASERRPGFVDRSVIGQQLLHAFLLPEYMRLNLIHCRNNTGRLQKAPVVLFQEIGHTNSAELTGFVSILHGTVDLVEVSGWLMDQEKIDGIQPQCF